MARCWQAVIVVLLCMTAASGQAIENVAGVRVVHNVRGGLWGTGPKVAIELVRTIGDVDTDDENLAFNEPLDIAVDEAGCVYILDSGNQRIQVCGPDGRFVRTIGRRGQGPGEFAGPNALDMDAEGRLHVLDGRQQRIQVFNAQGEALKTILASRHRIDRMDRMRLLGSGAYVTRSHAVFGMTGAPKQKSPPKLGKLLDAELDVRAEFGEPFDFGDELTNANGNSWEFAVDPEDNILLCFLYQNRVEKYSPEGRLLWRADRELNFPTKLIQRGEQKITPTSATYIAPKFNRVAVGIGADDKGRAWVVACDRQIRKEEVVTIMTSGSPSGMTRKTVGDTDLRTTDMFKLELFGPDGVLLEEIPLTHFVDLIHVHRDRLFLLDRDRGVQFYEYRIIEK
jgi:hypothetical protein